MKGVTNRLWLALALAAPAAAFAGGFNVSPISLEFGAAETAKALTLNNSSDRTINAQIRVFAWTQMEEQDVLTPSTDLVVSPPMATLAAGQQQLVRVLRTRSAAGDRELSYRLIVDEIPPAAPPAGTKVSGLKFVLRFSLPVFLAPAAGIPPPQTRWSLRTNPGSGSPFSLRAENSGGAHVKIADIVLTDASGKVLYEQTGLIGYALPGSQRQWPLPRSTRALSQTTHLRARINEQEETRPLSNAPPQPAGR